MKILIQDIPLEGLTLDFFGDKDLWFKELLADALGDLYQASDAAEGHIFCSRHGGQVDVTGEVTCVGYPLCSRCSTPVRLTLEVPVHTLLAPLLESVREVEIEHSAETELVKDDLEFSFYEGDSFNLGDLIREQIILSIPLQPLCRPECKGLCPRCGADLNTQACGCKEIPHETPFEVLKEFKPKHSS